MSIVRLAVVAAAIASASPAYAADLPARAGKTELYVCDPADAPRHLRRTAFGGRRFVTAEQALAGAGRSAAPQCIRPEELARLKAMRPAAVRDPQVAALTR